MFAREEVALVTGAATGIGRAVALAFARAGARVVVSDLDAKRGERTAEEARYQDAEAEFVRADVSDSEDVERLHETVLKRFGRLDHVCNNAGIEGEQAPVSETSLENFDRVLGVNLRGLFLCMREQLRIMRGQQQGSIVNMASVAGLVGFPGLPAYCASKGGVIQLTRTAALECAEEGIRVNAVCPAAIHTEMIERIIGGDAEKEAQFRAMHPMNRMGTPEEVADTVLWLCSRGAGFVTGQAIAVDGGMVAR